MTGTMDGDWTRLTHVELHQHVDEVFAGQLSRLELMLTHEREMRQEGARFNAQALQLQALDYKEHFERLNHAHEDAEKALNRTVQASAFEVHQEARRLWERRVDAQLDAFRGALVALGVALGILEFALRLVWK